VHDVEGELAVIIAPFVTKASSASASISTDQNSYLAESYDSGGTANPEFATGVSFPSK
jgi:hypothetical protein